MKYRIKCVFIAVVAVIAASVSYLGLSGWFEEQGIPQVSPSWLGHILGLVVFSGVALLSIYKAFKGKGELAKLTAEQD